MPMNCSGRSVEAASRVIEIEEVLVPMIASGFSAGQRLAKICALDVFFFGRRLDHDVAVLEARISLGRPMCLSAACRSSSLIAFVRTCRARLPLMVAMPALIRSARDVVELHVEPGKRADMGDTAAHLTRAYHPYLLDM